MRKKKTDRVNIPLIIDIADMFSNFKNWNTQRYKQYQKKNYNISNYLVNDSTIPRNIEFETGYPKWKPITNIITKEEPEVEYNLN